MKRSPLNARLISNFTCGCLVAATLSCSTGIEDIHRWADTVQGPEKIVAVLSHDKYSDELRIESAMTLVTMRPRSGQPVGLTHLMAGLTQLAPESRAMLLDGMVPRLCEVLLQQLPESADPSKPVQDRSFPFKDAAYALLSEPEDFVGSQDHRLALSEALRQWAVADFEGRSDNSTQAFGMGQLMLLLGPPGASRLPPLLTPDFTKIADVARFVADLGTEETKRKASVQLVKVAQFVDSKAWRDKNESVLRARNEASGFHGIEGPRFAAQLSKWQQEELMRSYASLRQVGQAPIANYLLGIAEQAERPAASRAAALAALEGQVALADSIVSDRLFGLAQSDETPDAVRELALRRFGELPRSVIIDRLYTLFTHSNWKVRWMAAELSLKTSELEHLPQFMEKLAGIKTMAITEPLRYGKLIGGLHGSGKPASVIGPYLDSQRHVAVRLTALGYYLEHGTGTDLAGINALAQDPMRVPNCPEKASQCEWRCEVTEAGARAVKTIQTVGHFVQHCVLPAIALRTPKAQPKSSAPTVAHAPNPPSKP